jgi:hypothetical protein
VSLATRCRVFSRSGRVLTGGDVMCTCSAYQQEKPMIPLMAQEKYQANGWLGLLLGTGLWFRIHGLENADDKTFGANVDPIVKEIGNRGKVKGSKKGDPPSSEDVPKVASSSPGTSRRQGTTAFEPNPEPAPAPAPAPVSSSRTPALAPAATATHTASAPVAPDAHSFAPSMQVQMSPASNAPGMQYIGEYGSVRQVAGSPNVSHTPLGQRLDGSSSSSLADLSTMVEIMNEQRQHMTELTQMVLAREDKLLAREDKLTQMVLAREDKHTDRMERMLQLQNDSTPRSPSTRGQTTPTEQQQQQHHHHHHQGRQAVSNTHDDVSGTALVALMGALGLPGWLIAHRAWLGRIVLAVILLRWRPLLRMLSRLGGV